MSASQPPETVYQLLTDALRSEGITHVFSLMGDGNLEFLADLAERVGLPLIHARHEQAAVAMADGYARFSGQVGVASVTHGPGLSNTATSLLTASAARSPVLLIAADTPAADPDHPQSFDQIAFARVTDARVQQLHGPETAARDAASAFWQARHFRRPVVLNAPADLLRAPLPGHGSTYAALPIVPPRAIAEPGAVRAAVDALVSARRPAILAGLGAALSGDAEAPLGRLSELLGAPVATTLMANGLLCAQPQGVGTAGGLGPGTASAVLREADCVLAVGASLNDWTVDGAISEQTVLLQLDIDPAAIGRHRPVTVALVGDAQLTLHAIVKELEETQAPRARWQPARIGLAPDRGALAGDGLNPRDVIDALDRALPARRALVVDAGHFSGFAQQGLRSSGPRDYTFTHQFGAIGQGLGIAAGACVARAGERVTVILGDGCLLMSVAELDTLARYRLPVTVFVMNDRGYGQERHALRAKGFSDSEASFPTPALAAVAEAFGIAARAANTPETLAEACAALPEADGPLLVDVQIDSGLQNRSFAAIADRLRGN